ncbi:MAG: transglycosylase domain-containing protein [Chloroflexota bacterium]
MNPRNRRLPPRPDGLTARNRIRVLRRARLSLLTRTHFAAMVNARPTSTLIKVTVMVFIALLLILPVTSAAAGAGAYTYYTRDFPSPETLGQNQSPRSTFIYDREGNLLYETFDSEAGRHMAVTLADLPSYVIDATLAVEDPNFYDNPGVDPRHIMRAFLQNLQEGGIASGASTITQQLVRNVFFDEKERYEQSYTRKIKEALLALQLSQWYTKDEILQSYLNEIWYGNLAYGIEAASWSFFGKHARELTLPEAALLVGLPQSPNAYDPYASFKAAKNRQSYVLDRMAVNQYITQTEADEAKTAPLAFAPRNVDIKSPHFVMYVRDQLERMLGSKRVRQGGLRIYTSLDPRLQQIAEDTAREHIATIKNLNANNAAVVAMDPRTAEVLAMVGSIDYWDDSIDGQINMAVAERQPGSTLKPITYATDMEKLGWGPATVMIDQPTDFPGGQGMPPYQPKNHDLKYRGPVTVRTALASSLNVPAVLALQAVGLPAMLEMAHRLGITSLTDPDRLGFAVTLGGGETRLIDLVFAYTAFANNGLQVGATVPAERRVAGLRDLEPVSIVKITDEVGNVIYDYKPPAGKEVLSPQIAYLITDILSDDEARSPTYGRQSFLYIDRPAAAKTGTTDNYRDGWTIGYTPQLVTGVWVGNADNTPMKDVYGVSGAGYIWGKFMRRALEGVPAAAFQRPSNGLVRATTCPITGQLVTAACPTKVEDWHLADSVPHDQCTLHQEQYAPPSRPAAPVPPELLPPNTRPTPTPAGSRP